MLLIAHIYHISTIHNVITVYGDDTLYRNISTNIYCVTNYNIYGITEYHQLIHYNILIACI